jgi:hypothetical protein
MSTKKDRSDKVPSKEEVREVLGSVQSEEGKIIEQAVPETGEEYLQPETSSQEIPKEEQPEEDPITWKEGDIKSASETVKHKLSKALNKKVDSTISISKEDDVWNAVVEVVDEEYLPGMEVNSMSDILGVYEVKLSKGGELLGWTKKSAHKRGQT